MGQGTYCVLLLLRYRYGSLRTTNVSDRFHSLPPIDGSPTQDSTPESVDLPCAAPTSGDSPPHPEPASEAKLSTLSSVAALGMRMGSTEGLVGLLQSHSGPADPAGEESPLHEGEVVRQPTPPQARPAPALLPNTTPSTDTLGRPTSGMLGMLTGQVCPLGLLQGSSEIFFGFIL